MSYPLRDFVPSEDELNFATRLLEMNNWNRTDSLSVDAAIGIFKQNGLSFKQLREIWSIADKDGSGELSRNELAIVIRLMGWVQGGETLDESLLKRAGPLPKIKGIPDFATTPTTEPTQTPPNVIQLPSTVESDVQDLIKDLKESETISGKMAVKFMSTYKIEPAELSKILQKADRIGKRRSTACLTMIEQLVRGKLASKLSSGQPSRSPPPSYHTPRTDLKSSIPRPLTGLSSRPTSPLEALTVVTPYPMSLRPPQYEPLPPSIPNEQPKRNLPSDSSPTSDANFLRSFQEKIERLSSQLETVVLEQSANQSDLQKTVKTLQEENLQLKIREVELQAEVARKEVEFNEAEKLTDLMRFEVLEKEVTIKEYEEEMDLTASKYEALEKTVDTQHDQIASLLDLVASLELTIKELHLNPAQNDLRLGFLRAEARASKAETAKVVSEADGLRQTLLKQDEELKELRRLNEEKKVPSSPVSRMNEDLSTLRDDHEGLKAQVKQMQFLLAQHRLPPSVQIQSEYEDDKTLVPGSVLPSFLVNTSSSSAQTISHDTPSEPYEPYVPKETHQEPSEANSRLEHDLSLLRLDLQRKAYMGGEIVQRLISEYGLDPSFLDEACRIIDLDSDWRTVEVVVNYIRQAIATGHGKSPVPSHSLPLIRPTISSINLTRYSTTASFSSTDEDSEEEEDEQPETPFSRLSLINPSTIVGRPASKTILKSLFKAKVSPTPSQLQKLHKA